MKPIVMILAVAGCTFSAIADRKTVIVVQGARVKDYLTRRVQHAIISLLSIAAILISFSAYAQNSNRVILIYGDADNGKAFSELLHNDGMACEMVAQAEIGSDWCPEADLLVFLACCRGGWGTPSPGSTGILDRVGSARVLACGNTGATLLGSKKLLIGYPQGAHSKYLPKIIKFPREIVTGPMGQILQSPKKLVDTVNDRVSIEIHSGKGKLSEVMIYDGGHFPAGTMGIGGNGQHHWTICKQGNYTLWGAESSAGNLTNQGRDLFANLCWYLANAKPEQLVFPEKVRVKAGTHDGTLEGGGRDQYYYTIKQEGELFITLEWDPDIKDVWEKPAPIEPQCLLAHRRHDPSMTMMTGEPVNKRVDGESPLEIRLQIPPEKIGAEFKITIGSFRLREGAKCPYRLTIRDKVDNH